MVTQAVGSEQSQETHQPVNRQTDRQTNRKRERGQTHVLPGLIKADDKALPGLPPVEARTLVWVRVHAVGVGEGYHNKERMDEVEDTRAAAVKLMVSITD